jgi:hypothetical protein
VTLILLMTRDATVALCRDPPLRAQPTAALIPFMTRDIVVATLSLLWRWGGARSSDLVQLAL